MSSLLPLDWLPATEAEITKTAWGSQLDQAAGDLQEAIQALLASLSDGWVWHVT
jgi:hypothetical protein